MDPLARSPHRCTRDRTASVSCASWQSGFLRARCLISRNMCAQHRWTRYFLYGPHPSDMSVPSHSGITSLRTLPPLLGRITNSVFPVSGSKNIHTQTSLPLRDSDVSSTCSTRASRMRSRICLAGASRFVPVMHRMLWTVPWDILVRCRRRLFALILCGMRCKKFSAILSITFMP